jgi:arylsulfatase A-like enzyme
MKRFLVSIAVLACCLASPSCRGRATSTRPNVVMLVVDTLRGDALGCYNETYRDLSPEIDHLAASGVQFRHVTAQSSWTRPAMGSLLTSRYPRELGIYREKYDVLPDRAVTLAEALRDAGYETAGITANPNLNRIFNFDQGFDTYLESDVVWDWMRPDAGKRPAARKKTLPDSRTMLKRMLDHARSRPGQPLYLQIVLMEVHEGWKLVRPEFKQNYRGLVGAPPGYWDGIRQVSFDVGWFVDELTSLPGWEDTLFILTSDHGQGLDDHPDVFRSWGHGLLLYDSQVKVPLILYNSAQRSSRSRPAREGRAWKPQQVDAPVRLMDVMPTVLDYLGLPMPAGIQGRSLLPLVTGDGKAIGLPPYFVTETYYNGSDKLAAHSADWNYIENRDGHDGVNAHELQRTGGPENGRLTDRIHGHPEVARELATYVRDWERRFPKRPATQPVREPSDEVVDQLKALGYVN